MPDHQETVMTKIDASVQGKWDVAVANLGVIGVHMALLNTGKVLLFSADHHDYETMDKGKAALWDPATDSVTHSDLSRHLLCSGHCMLPDGRVLVVGGQAYGQNLGQFLRALLGRGRGVDHDIHTFDPVTEKWSRHADLPRARWYPTCVTLPDGKAMLVCGNWNRIVAQIVERLTGSDRFGINDTFEIFDPETNTLTAPQPFLKDIGVYLFVHVLPGGFLYVHSWNKTRLFDLNKQEWIPQVFTMNSPGTRIYPAPGTSVLLPISPDNAQPARVLIAGGSTALKPTKQTPATDRVEIFELNAQDPGQSRWRETTPLAHRRFVSETMLLPDGTLLVLGGAEQGTGDHNHGAVLESERFDPVTETWQTLARASIKRLYHSTAALLPDGRVVAAGSTGHEWPPAEQELRLEVFSPPYLANGPRPVINWAPPQVSYGASFNIDTGDAQSIQSVAFVRPSTTTHNNNMDQRYVGLKIVRGNAAQLTVIAPPNGSVAPLGYYMLFIVNTDGVPSIAKFVRVQ